MSDGTTAGDSVAAVRRLVEAYDGAGVERQVSTDQANLSIAVDERWMVKWLRDPLAPDDITVLERLRDNGFRHTPALLGSIVVDGRVVALVHEFVSGVTDGWQWYVNDVLGWIDGSIALSSLVDTAATMGAITAELHLALAPSTPIVDDIAGVIERIDALCDAAFSTIAGEAGVRLAARRDRIERALAPLATVSNARVQPIHGDLHAGQFLRSDTDRERLLLTDFDGDPMVASDARLAMQPVERDLAGLLQSLDHVGRVAAKRRTGADVEPFIGAAIDACRAAYGARHVVDERLLWPLRVAQELHEYMYAATRLPAWLYVPDGAIVRLLP